MVELWRMESSTTQTHGSTFDWQYTNTINCYRRRTSHPKCIRSVSMQQNGAPRATALKSLPKCVFAYSCVIDMLHTSDCIGNRLQLTCVKAQGAQWKHERRKTLLVWKDLLIDLRWFIMMCGYSIGSVQIEKMSKNRGGKLQLHMWMVAAEIQVSIILKLTASLNNAQWRCQYVESDDEVVHT